MPGFCMEAKLLCVIAKTKRNISITILISPPLLSECEQPDEIMEERVELKMIIHQQLASYLFWLPQNFWVHRNGRQVDKRYIWAN